MTSPTADGALEKGLGSGFNRLWTASVASNLADGIGRTAVPLIATTLTRDPLLISVVGALAFVPWLLFGVLSGVVVDRVDRRRAMAVANSVRTLAAAAIALQISTGTLSIWSLYICVLVWGIGETVYDNATIAMIPSLVRKNQLEKANSRMQAADQLVQNFIAQPIAGVLFAVAIVIPVWSTAAGFFVAAALAFGLPLAAGRAVHTEDDGSVSLTPRAPTTARADAHEAWLFLWRNRFLRNMVVVTSAVGGFLSLAQAALVLFALETLEVPAAAFGLVVAGVGVGAIIGALVSSSLVARFGRGRVLFAASTLSGVGAFATGFSPNVYVAIVAFGVCAFAISVWNVPWGALRQDIVPGRLLGRVTGLIRTIIWGLFPIGTLLGGLIARIDLRLPFIVGGALMIIVSVAAVRLFLSAGRPTAELR